MIVLFVVKPFSVKSPKPAPPPRSPLGLTHCCLVYACVTAAKVSDIKVAQEMLIEAGATYVFDKGYTDYTWWQDIPYPMTKLQNSNRGQ